MDTTQIERAVSILLTNAELVRDPRMEHATDCYAVPVDDIEALRKASVAALAVPDVGGLTDERIKALAEQSLSYVFTSECAEVIDFARAIEREVLVAIGKPFLAAGGYWIKPHATKAAAEKPAGLDDRLDGLREAVSDFRKATYEFARGQDPEDHKRMMESQMRIFAEASALANAQPPEAAPAAPEQAVPEGRAERIAMGLSILRQDYSAECTKMASPREYAEDAVAQLIDAGYVPPVPAPANNAKDHAVQQAQQWAQEARTQRATVLSILRYFGLPEHDWGALRLIAEKVPAEQPKTRVLSVDGDHFSMAQVSAIRDSIKPGDGWDGDSWDFALANAVAAHVARQDQAAPDAERAAVPGALFNILPTITPEKEAAAERGFCPACNGADLKLINRSEGMRFFQCAKCKDITVLRDAAPVAQEFEPGSTEASAQAAPAADRVVAWELHSHVGGELEGRESPEVRIVFSSRMADEYIEEGWTLERELRSDKRTASYARGYNQPVAAQAAPAEQRDAARWRFMMRVADNDKGPEAQAMERLGNEQMEEGRPESEQMNELVDAAILALRSTSTDGTKGGAA